MYYKTLNGVGGSNERYFRVPGPQVGQKEYSWLDVFLDGLPHGRCPCQEGLPDSVLTLFSGCSLSVRTAAAFGTMCGVQQ